MSEDASTRSERLKNLWNGIARKSPALARCAQLISNPDLPVDRVAGLERARGEVLTHAAAITHPEVYERWGTVPAKGLLLVGRRGCRKSTLARSLATHLDSPLLEIDVPQLVLELLTRGSEVAPLVEFWEELFADFPRTTVHFEELDFERSHDTGERHDGLPVGPILEFLLRLISQTAASRFVVLVGSTSYPKTVRPALVARRRFHRTLAIEPEFPTDYVAVVQTHVALVEARTGRSLFEETDWRTLVEAHRELSPGDWVEVLHASLRSQARREAVGESVGPVPSAAVREEAAAFVSSVIATRPRPSSGNYL